MERAAKLLQRIEFTLRIAALVCVISVFGIQLYQMARPAPIPPKPTISVATKAELDALNKRHEYLSMIVVGLRSALDARVTQ